MSLIEPSCVYGFEYQVRTLVPLANDSEDITFFVGTQSLRQQNKIYKIDYDEENNLISPTLYDHSIGEIWNLSSSTFDKNILGTCYNKFESRDIVFNVGTIWKIQNEPQINNTNEYDDQTASTQKLENLDINDQVKNDLQPICTVTHPEQKDNLLETSCILWHPSGSDSTIITLSCDSIYVWDLNVSDLHTKLVASTVLEAKSPPEIITGRWNSNLDYTQIATVNHTFVRGWDLRTMKQTFLIDNGHNNTVRNIDFNTNRSYILASCGDDGKIKFWDTRRTTYPLVTVSNHSHWVWSVRFNPFHDELVLSSGSDARVCLSRVASISSEIVLAQRLDQEENEEGPNTNTPSEPGLGDSEKVKERAKDETIQTYEEHEESVYAAEWSTSDPWTFASISYDGRFIINRVPRNEKYRIIL